MSQKRTAHSVMLIQRRLRDAEVAAPDPLELVGIWDELSRIERKWREQIAAGSERRQRGDPQKLDDWFARLARQIERALRQGGFPDAETALLRDALEKCRQRKP